MSSFRYDQAEGLRRLLGDRKPQVLSFFSALPPKDKNALMVNLAASFVQGGNSVLMLDTWSSSKGVSSAFPACVDKTSLIQLASAEKKHHNSLTAIQPGLDMARLARDPQEMQRCPEYQLRLENMLGEMTEDISVLMIDVEWQDNNAFCLDMLAQGESVIQVSDDSESVKTAYMILKQLQHRFGQRQYSVLVSGKEEKRSDKVFFNLAETASRYLGITLRSAGFVPQDEYLLRAASQGRAVVEAFPKALASIAIRHVASGFSGTGLSDRMYEMTGA